MTQADNAAEPGSGDSGRYDHLKPLFSELAALPAEDPGRQRLRDQLVTGYLPVAKHIARRFSQRGEPQEDLTQVATLGLINAVDRFDAERGVDFLSFAVPTVMGEVRRHFRDASWAVRVPRRLKELHLSISAATSELSQRLGRAPTPSEIAGHLGLTREEVYEGLEATNAYRSASLDDLLIADDDSVSLGDALGEEDEGLAEVEYRESLQPLLAQLPERERTIVVLRFFGNMTQTQIADRVGISQMHVSRLLGRTLATLREKLMDEESG
ncbi:SigB/SigF/SigG family RNA polymerase sigma factor [Crossiella sp. CA198]|uniref:SigB/SigF/SigG family RNA polymerase sigma factor n=1 Tax=Crossiella sp. CA198 TaxID=3455607 RepID=UPI003F8D0314